MTQVRQRRTYFCHSAPLLHRCEGPQADSSSHILQNELWMAFGTLFFLGTNFNRYLFFYRVQNKEELIIEKHKVLFEFWDWSFSPCVRIKRPCLTSFHHFLKLLVVVMNETYFASEKKYCQVLVYFDL